MQYTFRVPKSDSHYQVDVNGAWSTTSYMGSLLVDPVTEDVAQVRIVTDALPEAGHLCQVASTLDFGAGPSAAAPILLPKRSQQQFVYPNLEETDNTTEFADCHEYSSESTVSFTTPASTPTAQASAAPPPSPVPAGLVFTAELAAPIDSDSAAAGDRFQARLVHDLRDHAGRMVARAGSIIEGRVRQVERLIPQNEIRVALGPTVLQRGGDRVPLAATLDWRFIRRSNQSRNPKQGMALVLPNYREAPSGLFQFAGQHVVLRKGFRSDWRTVEAAAK